MSLAAHRWRGVILDVAVRMGTGNLVIGLEPGPEQPCFAAEVYARDLGLADAPDDLKVNLGEQMLKGLFRCWAQRCGVATPDSLPITATMPQSDRCASPPCSCQQGRALS